MGIDIHGLNFLRYAKTFKNFGETITIGRQELHGIDRNSFMAKSVHRNDKYCEQLLMKYFGSNSVDAIDNSNYEGATKTHDMNQPLPSELNSSFDTIIDGGSLEHIFNVPQALKNCSQLCKPGGQILHVLPANNFCGHGFWQFSPELFFSLYSEENGYIETEVFLAENNITRTWFKVKPPKDGKRVTVVSASGIQLLVRTVLKNKNFSHSDVQQSDYVFAWTKNHKKSKFNKIRRFLRQEPIIYAFLSPIYRAFARVTSKSRLNSRNPGLEVHKVSVLLKSND